MTQEDIIRMAREVGLASIYSACDEPGVRYAYEDWDEELERFAALVAAAEREACAKVCEDASKPREGEMHSDAQWAGLVLSAAIRARTP
jgi:phosphoserine phosphatase